jgi:hypothetical protein
MKLESIISPIDGQRKWYWSYDDNTPSEVNWHGPFLSEGAAKADAARYSPSKWDGLTPAQQRHCEFMGFDPDNPDVPLD